jgi:hypothetical protein
MFWERPHGHNRNRNQAQRPSDIPETFSLHFFPKSSNDVGVDFQPMKIFENKPDNLGTSRPDAAERIIAEESTAFSANEPAEGGNACASTQDPMLEIKRSILKMLSLRTGGEHCLRHLQ